MYTVVNNNELYHHGVLGQKWGVRRYQNPDGSLTPKGQKRIQKMTKYQSKMQNKSKKHSENYKKYAEDAEFDIEDLKRRGVYSKPYMEWKESKIEQRTREYNDRYKTSTTPYKDSSDFVIDNIFDSIGSKKTINKLINDYTDDAKEYRDRSDKWMKKHDEIMSMKIDINTTKGDIKKIYRG